VVEIDMEGGTLILAQPEPITAQPKPIMIHVITTPNFDNATVDLKINVGIEGIKVANMEE
jgi:hypothetical protein